MSFLRHINQLNAYHTVVGGLSQSFIELSIYSQANFLRLAIPYGDIIYIYVYFNPDTQKIYLSISIKKVKNIKSPSRKTRSYLYCFCKLTSNKSTNSKAHL